MRDQQKLNNKVLEYFKQRMDQGLADIPFIHSELKRAVSIEDFQLAEAIKQALLVLGNKEEKEV